MIKERVQTIIRLSGINNPKLEELTGISRFTWQNVRYKHDREIKESEITAIANLYPQYQYWIISGAEIPEAGQINPMSKGIQ